MLSPIFRAGPLSIGDLLDWAIRLYRARFGKLILTTAIFLVPIGVLSGIISGQTTTSYLQILLRAMQDPEILADRQLFADIQGDNSTLITLSYLLMPLSIAAGGLVSLALTRQSLAAVHNQELSIGEGIRLGLQRFWPWLGMTLATYAVYVGVIILVAIILFIVFLFLAVVASGFMNVGNWEGSQPGVVGFAGLLVGVFCLYVGMFILMFSPFVYLSTRWAVAIPILVDQNIGPLEALSESWKLTKGNVRRSVAYVVLLYLFYGIIYAAFMTIAVFVSSLTLTSNMLASVAIFGAVGAVLPILWQPIASAAYTMLYYDLRMRNQAYDVELRIQQLEAEVERGAYASA